MSTKWRSEYIRQRPFIRKNPTILPLNPTATLLARNRENPHPICIKPSHSKGHRAGAAFFNSVCYT